MRATELLRAGLLEGVSTLIAAPPDAPFGAATGDAFTALGASVCTCLPDGRDETACDESVKAALAQCGAIDVLLVDGPALFAGEPGGLHGCVDAAWNITRAAVNHAFLPAGGGRIVYLAPARGAGEHAGAAGAALENLARTLSVEWARHRINVVTVIVAKRHEVGGPVDRLHDLQPGDARSAKGLAALVAYLASPAGDYFSGCLLEPGGL